VGRLRVYVAGMLHNYPAVVWFLGLGSLINVGGLSLLWPVNAIYIHTVLGKSLTVAGLVLMLYSGSGFIGNFLGGWLYDKVGPVSVLTFGLATSAAVICVPIFVHTWWVYIVVMGIFGVTCAMPFPVMSALAGHAWPGGGRRAYNFIYVANNLGVAVGTALGGVLAQWSFHAVFIGIGLAYISLLVLVQTVFRERFNSVGTGHSALSSGKHLPSNLLPVVPWIPIAVLFAGFIAAWSMYVQWQSTISVYMQSLGYPLTDYSILWTLNGLLIFAAQPAVAKVIRRFPSLSAHMSGGVFLYGMAYLLLFLNHGYVAFVFAMVVMTAGELFVWPSVPAAVAQLAPSHRLGLLQGLVGSAATVGRMMGPVVGGVLYDRVDMNGLLIVLVIFTAFPVLNFWLFGRLLKIRLDDSLPSLDV
jgi:MFS family permease